MKRYFTTNEIKNKFPDDFFNSKHEKHVIVINCKLFIKDDAISDEIEAFHVPKFVTLHADFIHEKRYLDSFVMFTNQESVYPKKYQQLASEREFNVWFKHIDGTPVDMTNTKFILELLLCY